jgi:uncharacterized membrane protein
MSDLVVIAFPSEAKAEEIRQKLLDMQKDYLIGLGDAVRAAPCCVHRSTIPMRRHCKRH